VRHLEGAFNDFILGVTDDATAVPASRPQVTLGIQSGLDGECTLGKVICILINHDAIHRGDGFETKKF
jgi:hypothetical protein